AMALGAGESMWPVMGGLKWSRGYHAIAATALTPRDIVLGHGVWMTVRTGLASSSVAAALALFPDTRSWGLIPSVLIAVWVGLAFAMPVMAFSIKAELDGAFAAIQRFVVIPLFLFGGAFYPLSQLPAAIAWLARVAPLWHGVVMARQCTTGTVQWGAAALHLGYIGLWVAAGTTLAAVRMRKRLST
ncbi:MAG: ABC transporter permease, partial [Ilumatobacter sp.]|nr:ABC transporter permease [Ilumatobacter sp.]